MSKLKPRRWIVLFDKNGVDTLIPVDQVEKEEILSWFSGEEVKEPGQTLAGHVRAAIMRATFGSLNGPELWLYTAGKGWPKDEDKMRNMWKRMPQQMANLIREKGVNFMRRPGFDQVIK